MFSVPCAVVVKKNKPKTKKICQARKSWSFYRGFFFLPLNKEESEEFELFMRGIKTTI